MFLTCLPLIANTGFTPSNFRNDTSFFQDNDGDGVLNADDIDDDGDGLIDSIDQLPLVPSKQSASLFDIDGNGEVDALTDTLLITRYVFGFRGDALTNGAVSDDATRTSSEEIEAYLEALIPEL